MKKITMILFLLLTMMALSACSETPTATDRFSKYIELWNDQKFSEMYDMLSASTKETISKDEFIRRYKGIYKGISAKNVKVTFKKPEEEQNQDKQEEVVYPFSLTMDTLAGEVSFEQDVQLKKEKVEDGENWFITWSTHMIFPQLEEGEEVRVSSTPPARGQIFDQNDKGLAVNGIAHEIGLVPEKLPEKRDEALAKISTLLELDVAEIESKLNQSWVKPDYFVPIKMIDPSNTALLEKLIAIPSV